MVWAVVMAACGPGRKQMGEPRPTSTADQSSDPRPPVVFWCAVTDRTAPYPFSICARYKEDCVELRRRQYDPVTMQLSFCEQQNAAACTRYRWTVKNDVDEACFAFVSDCTLYLTEVKAKMLDDLQVLNECTVLR